MAEFRSKVLEVDLFHAIEQDAAIIPEIKELLNKLSKTHYGRKFEEFSQALEPLMEEIHLSFHQKKTDQSKLEDQTVLCNRLMAEVSTFQINLSIAKHEEEIRLLKLQITKVLEKEDRMRKEASIAIQKIKESQTSQQEMTMLVKNGKLLDERLAGFKGRLNKLKSEFVI